MRNTSKDDIGKTKRFDLGDGGEVIALIERVNKGAPDTSYFISWCEGGENWCTIAHVERMID